MLTSFESSVFQAEGEWAVRAFEDSIRAIRKETPVSLGVTDHYGRNKI